MTMTLEQLMAQRDALVAARFSGALSVRAGDKQITYKSDAEMRTAVLALDREIARASHRPAARRIRTVCGKGL